MRFQFKGPAALMTGVHLAISLLTSVIKPGPPRRSLPGISLPRSRSRLRVGSSSSALSSAAESLSVIGFCVPLGAISAF